MSKVYEFTLKYKISEADGDLDAIADLLYANGCDDALIGVGVAGRIALDFSREATSAEEAVFSAHHKVLSVIPDAMLIEAMPDYVGLTDIAEVVSVSRQQMRKLYETHSSFPAPVHEGSSSVWRLFEVLDWILDNKDYQFDAATLEVARVNSQLNSADRARSVTIKQSTTRYSRVLIKAEDGSMKVSLTFTDSQSLASVAEAA